jgi:hypothetical protein
MGVGDAGVQMCIVVIAMYHVRSCDHVARQSIWTRSLSLIVKELSPDLVFWTLECRSMSLFAAFIDDRNCFWARSVPDTRGSLRLAKLLEKRNAIIGTTRPVQCLEDANHPAHGSPRSGGHFIGPPACRESPAMIARTATEASAHHLDDVRAV